MKGGDGYKHYGTHLIERERRRQIKEEGWSSEHDDEHDDGQLAIAGAVYALPRNVRVEAFETSATEMGESIGGHLWPFSPGWWKPSKTNSVQDRINELVKAGALIAAEIDRLNRTITSDACNEEIRADDELRAITPFA